MVLKKYSGFFYFILGVGLLYILHSFSQNGRYYLSEDNYYVIDSQTGDIYYKDNKIKGKEKEIEVMF